MKLQHKFEELKCCIIIPTYNNDRTLASVINDVYEYTSSVIVITDGSDDNTDDILDTVVKTKSGITILKNEVNKGKGYSLRKAFKYACEQGYQYALTIDSDGQHLTKDIPVFLETLQHEPNTLLIGARDMDVDNVPRKSSVGKKFSNFWISVTTGLDLSDTQSGFRLYPINRLKEIKFVSSRFEFEVEVIVKSVWNGINVKSVPIHVYYAPKADRISHYRPFTDFMRISMLNVLLVTLSLFVFWPQKMVRTLRQKGLKQIFKEEILKSTESNIKIALSIGFGVFMGIVPIWGYQLIVGFTLAHLMKLNKGIFFLAANISIPPMIPVILLLSFYTGGLLMGGDGYFPTSIDQMTMSAGFTYLKQYLIGSIVLAIVSGSFMTVLSYYLLSITNKVKK